MLLQLKRRGMEVPQRNEQETKMKIMKMTLKKRSLKRKIRKKRKKPRKPLLLLRGKANRRLTSQMIITVQRRDRMSSRMTLLTATRTLKMRSSLTSRRNGYPRLPLRRSAIKGEGTQGK